MIRILIGFILMLSMSVAQAADIALMLAGSVRYNSTTTDLSGANANSKTSFGGGVLGVAPITDQIAFRSGFMVTQRYVELGPTTQGNVEINFAYVDVPLTPMLLLSNEVGVFAGPVIAMNVVKDCSSAGNCGANNVKSVVVPLTIGVQARLAGQVGAEIFYERTMGSLADYVSDFSTVGANILFYFD